MNLLDQLRIISIHKDKLLVGPKSIYIDINTECNLNCNFCWIHSPLNKKPLYKKPLLLSFEDIKKIIDKAYEWRCEELIISGDGEPTLHPEFKEIVRYITKKNFRVFLTTNATFNKELLNSILNIDYLYITFSAPQKDLYFKIQSPKNPYMYEKVLRNIKILSKFKEKYKRPYLNIAFIINKTNYRTIPDMLKLGEKLKIDKITFRIMEATPYTKKLSLSKQEKQELIKIITKASKYKTNLIHNLKEIKEGILKYNKSPFKLKSCFTGWFNLFIDFNKNVGLCCHNEKLIVGNLKKKSLEEIWKSKLAHKKRLMCKYEFNLKKEPFKGECQWCHWYRENREIMEKLQNLQNDRRIKRNNF